MMRIFREPIILKYNIYFYQQFYYISRIFMYQDYAEGEGHAIN